MLGGEYAIFVMQQYFSTEDHLHVSTKYDRRDELELKIGSDSQRFPTLGCERGHLRWITLTVLFDVFSYQEG